VRSAPPHHLCGLDLARPVVVVKGGRLISEEIEHHRLHLRRIACVVSVELVARDLGEVEHVHAQLGIDLASSSPGTLVLRLQSAEEQLQTVRASLQERSHELLLVVGELGVVLKTRSRGRQVEVVEETAKRRDDPIIARREDGTENLVPEETLRRGRRRVEVPSELGVVLLLEPHDHLRQQVRGADDPSGVEVEDPEADLGYCWSDRELDGLTALVHQVDDPSEVERLRTWRTVGTGLGLLDGEAHTANPQEVEGCCVHRGPKPSWLAIRVRRVSEEVREPLRASLDQGLLILDFTSGSRGLRGLGGLRGLCLTSEGGS
jgi:hypothetical protein